ENPLEVVDRLDQTGHDFEPAPFDLGLALGSHPLAVVVEVGLGPLGEFQILVPLAAGFLDQRVQVLLDAGFGRLLGSRLGRRHHFGVDDLFHLGLARGFFRLLGHLFSSSSTTSASITSSSSEESAPPSGAPSAPAAWASAWAAW